MAKRKSAKKSNTQSKHIVPARSQTVPNNPWHEFAGIFKNDEDYANVKKNIARYRRQLDKDTTRP